jgi:hypothetical protein
MRMGSCVVGCSTGGLVIVVMGASRDDLALPPVGQGAGKLDWRLF